MGKYLQWENQGGAFNKIRLAKQQQKITKHGYIFF